MTLEANQDNPKNLSKATASVSTSSGLNSWTQTPSVVPSVVLKKGKSEGYQVLGGQMNVDDDPKKMLNDNDLLDTSESLPNTDGRVQLVAMYGENQIDRSAKKNSNSNDKNRNGTSLVDAYIDKTPQSGFQKLQLYCLRLCRDKSFDWFILGTIRT